MTDATLGIDVGTQGVRAIVVDATGSVLSTARLQLPLGLGDRREQDPEEWWSASINVAAAAVAQAGTAIRALSVTATSGTLVLTDEHLRCVRPAILWNDKRAAAEAAKAADVLEDPAIRAGYALSKAMWVKDHEPEVWNDTKHVLGAGDWILARLSGDGPVTDYTNALKMGADLERLCWPDALTDLGLDLTGLPEIVSPGTALGAVTREFADAVGIQGAVVHAGVTDANAAQIAAGTVGMGDWVTTIGTGLSVKGVTADRITDPAGAIYSHRHWQQGWIPSGTSHCGSDSIATVFAGADLQELTHLADTPSSILVLPLTTVGEDFPFRDRNARGFEIGDPANDADRFRGYLEGIAFIERLSMERMHAAGATAIGSQVTMGGGANNELWMRIRAAVLGRPIERPLDTSSAMGAAIIAAAGDSAHITSRARSMVRPGMRFDPESSLTAHYDARYATFVGALAERGYWGDVA